MNDIAVNTGAIVTTTTPITTTTTTSTTTTSSTTTTTVSGGMMIKKESCSVKRNSVLVKVIIVVFVELSSRCSVSMIVGVCMYIYICRCNMSVLYVIHDNVDDDDDKFIDADIYL